MKCILKRSVNIVTCLLPPFEISN